MSAKPTSRARAAHRRVATILLLFIAIHLATHFAALGGIDAHTQALHTARLLYRVPLVEPLLIAAFALQIGLGIVLVRARMRAGAEGFWGKAQVASGIYLAAFLVMHSGAALGARLLSGLDTNFYWPAGTLVLDPLRWMFAPYYALAIAAVFLHLGAALHFRGNVRTAATMPWAAGIIVLAIVPTFAGLWYPVIIPGEYLSYYRSVFGDGVG